VVNSRASEFRRLESQFGGYSTQIPIYGWQINALELPDELKNADLIYDINVFDDDYFSHSQLLQVEKQIVEHLKPGGLHVSEESDRHGFSSLMGNSEFGMETINAHIFARVELKQLPTAPVSEAIAPPHDQWPSYQPDPETAASNLEGLFHDFRRNIRIFAAKSHDYTTSNSLPRGDKFRNLDAKGATLLRRVNRNLSVKHHYLLRLQNFVGLKSMIEELRTFAAAFAVEPVKSWLHHLDKALELIDSKARTSRREELNLNPFLEERLGQYQDSRITFSASAESGYPPINASPFEIGRAIDNLIDNARRAIELAANGHIWVSTRYQADEQRCVLEIQDNGPGIELSMLPLIFKHEFTTKVVNEEDDLHGVGLSVVMNTMRTSGGILTVASRPGEGTVFILSWPAAPAGESLSEADMPPEDIPDFPALRPILAAIVDCYRISETLLLELQSHLEENDTDGARKTLGRFRIEIPILSVQIAKLSAGISNKSPEGRAVSNIGHSSTHVNGDALWLTHIWAKQDLVRLGEFKGAVAECLASVRDMLEVYGALAKRFPPAGPAEGAAMSRLTEIVASIRAALQSLNAFEPQRAYDGFTNLVGKFISPVMSTLDYLGRSRWSEERFADAQQLTINARGFLTLFASREAIQRTALKEAKTLGLNTNDYEVEIFLRDLAWASQHPYAMDQIVRLAEALDLQLAASQKALAGSAATLRAA